MKIEVNYDELFALLESVNPTMMDTDSRFKPYIGYAGGMGDRWWWKKDEVLKLDTENVYRLYLSAKQSKI